MPNFPAPSGLSEAGTGDTFASITVENGCVSVRSCSGTSRSTLPWARAPRAISISCYGDPVELAVYENTPGGSETVCLAIDHFCGSTSPLHLRMVVFADGDGCSLADAERDTTAGCTSSSAQYCFESGIFDDPQIYGHPATAGALAVAAS